MAEQSIGDPFKSIRPTQWGQNEHSDEASVARACLFTFVGTAAATLIVCSLAPGRPIPDVWHSMRPHRALEMPNEQAKGASAASGLSTF
jgi:hypothetical protein